MAGEVVRILGLDLSLTSTGYCLLQDDHVEWYGSVALKSRDVIRLADFDTWIRDAIEQHGLAMGYAAIEGYSYGSPQGHTHAFAIGELGGVIKVALHDHGMDVRIVPPATWKKQLLGKGNLAKDQVRLEAWKRYGVEFPSQDTLDAWAVAMCLRRQLLGLDQPEPKSRRRTTDLPLIPATEAIALDEESTPSSRRATRAAAH